MIANPLPCSKACNTGPRQAVPAFRAASDTASEVAGSEDLRERISEKGFGGSVLIVQSNGGLFDVEAEAVVDELAELREGAGVRQHEADLERRALRDRRHWKCAREAGGSRALQQVTARGFENGHPVPPKSDLSVLTSPRLVHGVEPVLAYSRAAGH